MAVKKPRNITVQPVQPLQPVRVDLGREISNEISNGTTIGTIGQMDEIHELGNDSVNTQDNEAHASTNQSLNKISTWQVDEIHETNDNADNTGPIYDISAPSSSDGDDEIVVTGHLTDQNGLRFYNTRNNGCIIERNLPPERIIKYFVESTNSLLSKNYELRNRNKRRQGHRPQVMPKRK